MNIPIDEIKNNLIAGANAVKPLFDGKNPLRQGIQNLKNTLNQQPHDLPNTTHSQDTPKEISLDRLKNMFDSLKEKHPLDNTPEAETDNATESVSPRIQQIRTQKKQISEQTQYTKELHERDNMILEQQRLIHNHVKDTLGKLVGNIMEIAQLMSQTREQTKQGINSAAAQRQQSQQQQQQQYGGQQYPFAQQQMPMQSQFSFGQPDQNNWGGGFQGGSY